MSRSMFEAKLKNAYKPKVKHTILDLGHAMGFRMPRSMFEAKLKKAYKTLRRHIILDLGHALLTHHEAQRIHKPHECHLDGSWEHLGASCGPSGNNLGVFWGPSQGLSNTFNLSRSNHKSSSFNLAWRNARSRLNNRHTAHREPSHSEMRPAAKVKIIPKKTKEYTYDMPWA